MVRDSQTHHECVSRKSTDASLGKLIAFCGVLSSVHRIRKDSLVSRLPVRESCNCAFVGALKKFCGGLIEGSAHPWREVIRGLGRRSRLSVAASLFLFRKVLPTPKPDCARYVERMSQPQDPADPDFLAFCGRKLEKMFPPGWDVAHYNRSCDSSILTDSSCVEWCKKDGGVREYVATGSCWFGIDAYDEIVKTAKPNSLTLEPSRVVDVDTGGKKRIVSVSSAGMNFLRPLHHAIYDRLSRFPWLLRGDASPSVFKDFIRSPGEVFVSGDYESATDNLNLEVQKFILRKVLENARCVPQGVRDLAVASQEMYLQIPGERAVRQRRGQLMGNLLSFPLLCIVNFLGFKFAVRRRVPLKINGDDIVFRALPEEVERWEGVVRKAGLTLSAGKTLVDKRFFSLNSAFFEALPLGVKWLPFIRPKSLFGCVEEGVFSLADRSRAFCRGFSGERKRSLDLEFLRANRRFILASRRSVSNGLMIRTTESLLKDAGLLNRERCYIEPTGDVWIPEVRLDEVAKRASPYKVEGWRLERHDPTDELKELQKKHAALLRREVWTCSGAGKLLLEEKKRLIKETGWNVANCGISSARVKRFARLAGCSVRAASRALNRPRSLPHVRRDARGGREWWVPTDRRPRSIVFVRSSE